MTKRIQIMFLTLIIAVGLSISVGVGSEFGLENVVNDVQASFENNDTKNIELHFLDVGQGDSAFVILPDGKTMLIDASTSNQGTNIVNYLKNLNITKIDYLVVTHPDNDHYGGMSQVIDNFDIGTIYMTNYTNNTTTYTKLVQKIQNKGLNITIPNVNDTVSEFADYKIIFLSPNQKYSQSNDMSLVIQIHFKYKTFLFMGDASTKVEKDILNSNPNLFADLIKIGHHGSYYSSSARFIDQVSPQFAIISSGVNNQYGHPHDLTLDTLKNYKVNIYRTDQVGHIIAVSDGNIINITTQKGNGTGISNFLTNYIIKSIKIA